MTAAIFAAISVLLIVVAIAIIVACNIWGKGMVKIIPIPRASQSTRAALPNSP